MQITFYHHLVEINSVVSELNTLDLSEKEKNHLTTLLSSSIHTVVLNIVLSEIPEHDKKFFLEHVHENDSDKIWDFLHKRTISIEAKIQKAVKDVKKEFLDDIKELKKKT